MIRQKGESCKSGCRVHLLLFEIDIRRSPLILACIFSSVMSSSSSLKISLKSDFKLSNEPFIGISSKLRPKLLAKDKESLMLPFELNSLGIVTPKTFSEPNALSAKTAVKAESIPPLKPIRAVLNPHFILYQIKGKIKQAYEKARENIGKCKKNIVYIL